MYLDVNYHGWLNPDHKVEITHYPDTASVPYARLRLGTGVSIYLTPQQVIELHDILGAYVDARAAEAESTATSAQAAFEAQEHSEAIEVL